MTSQVTTKDLKKRFDEAVKADQGNAPAPESTAKRRRMSGRTAIQASDK
ncbi:hypothetical protein [Xanthobacter agilis]